MKRILKVISALSLAIATSAGQAIAQSPTAVDRIGAVVAKSDCATYYWKNRGPAPAAYIKGMAVVFARAICSPQRPDVIAVSSARRKPGTQFEKTDGLTWYDNAFRALGMLNNTPGSDTLRHAYALMIGLGMRETSGKYCSGRDLSANFTSADSAEAGLFQTSWGASKTHSTLPQMFDSYSADQSACLLDVFKEKIKCTRKDASTWGTGKGAKWQILTKACPAFATEYAAVVLRTSGGSNGEYGPIRKRAAELRPECDAMLLRIQDLIRSEPELCSKLK